MITETLNEKQQEAAEHVDGPLLVLAGAGSGKTRIVTHRIVHLLEIGVPAQEILAVTFTNKAAGEMSSRVRALTKQNVLITTFHSLCARLLRESIHHIGYKQTFTIYDEQDSQSLIKECLKTLGIKEDKQFVKSIKGAISDAKNALVAAEEMPVDLGNRKLKTIRDVYKLYQDKLFEYNALDFDDLLFLTVRLFQECPEVLKHYEEQFTFLLIDEYQDTNEAQYIIAKLLAGEKKNIFVVGDPDQSIYSWRGANIRNILNFEKDFPGAKTITLDQNYRSTNNILSAANCVIKNNPRPYDKDLWSGLGDGEKIFTHTFSSDREEAAFVVRNIIKYQKEENMPLSNVVVFYRTNAQSRSFEDAFLKENIPYAIIGGLSFYQRKEIKDVLAFLRLIISPSDLIAFARTINLPKRGFGPTSLAKLKEASERSSIPIMNLCASLMQGTSPVAVSLSAKQRANLADYLQMYAKLMQLQEQQAPIETLIKTLLEESGYLLYLKEDKETYEDRRANIDELLTKALEWESDKENPSLFQFLEELSLQSSMDENQKTEEHVSLMTLHNGKGLEFDLCFIVGMEEDLFPHINSKEDETALEEERRLCYVGMTRAKKYLYLTASRFRYLWGMPKVMNPSRFLNEIPEKYKHPSVSARPPSHFQIDNTFDEENPSDGLLPGRTIEHKSLGKGVIRKRYSTSLGLTFDIYFFADNQVKTIAAKYAKLSLVYPS